MPATVPLYRALSKLGFASRTEAVALIAGGAISVDGTICRDPDRPVTPECSRIVCNGKVLRREPLRVVMLYKPKSIITSRSDEQGRPTVYSLLPAELQSLHCVGRLDYATSGLLLLTNDTRLSSWLTDPAHKVPRIYIVTVRGLMTPEKAATMLAGIDEGGETLRTESVVIRKSSRRESHLVLTLAEGKNREIRRLCASLGHEVTKLKRVQYGGLVLGSLEPGGYREVDREELSAAFPEFRISAV